MDNKISDGFLRVENLTKKFGEFIAVDRVNYSLKKNEVATIIGPNGAGKTTFFNLITGYFPPDEGTVLYEGEDITGFSPQKRVSLGMMRTFQLTSTFDNVRVIDNLILSCFRAYKKSSITGMLLSKLSSNESDEKIIDCLKTFDLSDVAYKETKRLSLGQKRRLEIAMAHIAKPKVLLLDEPLAGLSDAEIDEVLEVLKRHAHQQTMLLVEHKISKVMTLTERLTVMHDGKIIADGDCEEVINSPEVRKCYWQIDI